METRPACNKGKEALQLRAMKHWQFLVNQTSWVRAKSKLDNRTKIDEMNVLDPTIVSAVFV
jgi:hypothetical protein